MQNHRLPLRKSFLAAGIGLSGAYVVCILLDRLVPDLRMIELRLLLLPAFTRLTPRTFLIGFAGSFLSGAFFAALMVPLYNAYFSIRDRFEERAAASHNDRLRYF